MEKVFLYAGIYLLFLMGLSLYRAVAGPTILDRITGVNVVGTKTTVLLLFIGILFRDLEMFVDIALAYALLNFIASLASAKFFLRRNHPEDNSASEGKGC